MINVVMTSDPTVIVERANRMQKEVRQGGLKQKKLAPVLAGRESMIVEPLDLLQ